MLYFQNWLNACPSGWLSRKKHISSKRKSFVQKKNCSKKSFQKMLREWRTLTARKIVNLKWKIEFCWKKEEVFLLRKNEKFMLMNWPLTCCWRWCCLRHFPFLWNLYIFCKYCYEVNCIIQKFFFCFFGLWSQSAGKLTIHSIPCSWIYISQPFLKVHPPICRITVYAPMPG